MKQPNEGQEQSGSVVEMPSENGQSELELLRAECARLREQVKQLEKERDDYRKVAYAWVHDQITIEDIQTGALEEEGEPLEAFLPELEKIVRGENP